MNLGNMKDEGEDSGGGEPIQFAPVLVLKLKVHGELVGEPESYHVPVLNTEGLVE